MVKHAYFILIALLISGTSLGQKLRVDYVVRVNPNNNVTSTIKNYVLNISGQQSLYTNPDPSASDFVHEPYKVEEGSGGRRLAHINERVSAYITQDYFYKDYREGAVVFNDYIQGKKFVVRETMPLMAWEPINGVDSIILGQRCYLATCEFRGRTYEAWYSPEANPFGGPWKFDGLPGLILACQSTDDYFIMQAVRLQLNMPELTVENPFAEWEEPILTWDAFVETTEEKLRVVAKRIRAAGGMGGKIEITDRIENLGIGVITY